MGEIVVKDMDTPDNHRRLGEIRAGELERAMAALGVTEWDNLGYHDSDMMGRAGNRDPRSFWQADLDDAARRLVWMIRRYQPDVITTYDDFGGYGHPDHIRTHDVTVRAFPRAGDAAWYPEQLEDGLAPWTPSKLYEQAIPASVRDAIRGRMEEQGKPNPWAPPADATPEQLAEFEAFQARMLVPDESITTWVDISGDPVERKWVAMKEHVTQIAEDSFFMAFGLDGWREQWSKEAYILRESTVATDKPEDDLFAGLS
jgi:N-acetyl-1-D-myo-inositol-2-amino-2-deoxy-alpha-D-glucopyranoside deacetylase